jgi:hypothetical protein
MLFSLQRKIRKKVYVTVSKDEMMLNFLLMFPFSHYKQHLHVFRKVL